MIVTFFGHSAVGLTAERSPRPGFKVLIDPYEPGGFAGALRYPPIVGRFAPDLILSTHAHADHRHVAAWPDVPVSGPDLPDVESPLAIHWSRCAHDAFDGALRGGETGVCRLMIDGVHVVHTGDLGELPPPEVLDSWRPCDLLLVAAGGHYTLGASGAVELALRLAARVTVPVHLKSPHCDLPYLADASALAARLPTLEHRRGQWRYSEPFRAGLILMEPA